MQIPEILVGHRADFLIWIDPKSGLPYGRAETKRGKEVYGEEVLSLIEVDVTNFWGSVPDDVIVGVVTGPGTIEYASKNLLQ